MKQGGGPLRVSWVMGHRTAAVVVAMLAFASTLGCVPPSESAAPAPKIGGGHMAPGAGSGFAPPPTSLPVGEPLRLLADAPDLDPAPNRARFELRAETIAENAAGLLYGYNGQSPGPVLRVPAAAEVVVEFTNALDMPTSVHWHGLHVPFAMDGGLASDAEGSAADPEHPVAMVEAGNSFRFEYSVSNSGTFWFHPHFDSSGQVDLGLVGAVVVEDPNEPAADVDEVLVLDVVAERSSVAGTLAGHGNLYPIWLVNGQVAPQWRVPAGASVRARLLNASNVSYAAISAENWRVIGGDQGLLEAPDDPDRLILAPGDRAEVEFWPGSEPIVVMNDHYSLNGGLAWPEPVELFRIVPEGTAAPAAPLEWPFRGRAPSPDVAAPTIVWTFAGDHRSDEWFINGRQFPDIEPDRISFGEPAIAEIRNLSASEHPFHLHGMDFEVLSIDGRPPEVRRIEDTINVRIGQVVRVMLRPVFAGLWMAHCHILPHSDRGMMTLLRVASPP